MEPRPRLSTTWLLLSQKSRSQPRAPQPDSDCLHIALHCGDNGAWQLGHVEGKPCATMSCKISVWHPGHIQDRPSLMLHWPRTPCDGENHTREGFWKTSWSQ